MERETEVRRKRFGRRHDGEWTLKQKGMGTEESGRVWEWIGSGSGMWRSRRWGGGGGSMRQRKALFLVRRLTHNTKFSTVWLLPSGRKFGLEIRKRAHILRTSDGRSLINLFESQRKGS
jgi:hypothetical protein